MFFKLVILSDYTMWALLVIQTDISMHASMLMKFKSGTLIKYTAKRSKEHCSINTVGPVMSLVRRNSVMLPVGAIPNILEN